MLFDNINRIDDSFKRNAETSFGFLNRSSRAEIARVRGLLVDCFDRYPKSEKPELLARLRSGDERHFRSGCFELLLHEYLTLQGFQLVPHPTLPNGSKSRPDFLVNCPDGARLYLEAASASENTGDSASAEAMKAVVMASLESATHPDFFVEISSRGDPKTQPSGGKLRDAVLRWLNTLKWGEIVVLDHDAFPELNWSHEDWILTVRPIPVKETARGKQRRLLGINAGRAGWVDTWSPIRDSVVAKSRHYGELDLPLVVAVNVDTFALDPIDEMQALFGQEVVVVSSRTSQPQLHREPNGAWMGERGPRARRASGAWLFSDLTPYSIAGRRQMLYLNPWANLAVPPSFLVMPHNRVDDACLQPVDGRSFHEVYGLAPRWPGE